MDLELTIPHARGAQATATECSYLRDLDENDIVILSSGVNLQSATPAIKRLRNSHHELAQLLASGITAVVASQITGYSQSRISILQHDPAFKELLAHYTAIKDQINVDVLKRARQLGIDVLEALHERVLSQEDDLTVSEMIKVAELTLDRAGFGPKSTVQHEHGISATTLEALKNEIDREHKGNVIETSVHQRLEERIGSPERPGIHREAAEVVEFSEERPAVPEPSGEVSGGEA